MFVNFGFEELDIVICPCCGEDETKCTCVLVEEENKRDMYFCETHDKAI